jgi:hypothetical protein
VYERDAPDDEGFYNVATAASITGYVRAMLWRTICASDGVLYCDTDSLICERFAGDIGPNLGQWSLECNVSAAYIAQRKMYALKSDEFDDEKQDYKWKTASKGVQLSVEQIVNGVKNKVDLKVAKISPAFSLKYGQRFFKKTIAFSRAKS